MLVWIKYFFKKGKNELERGTSTSFQLEPLELVQCGSGGQWSRSSTSPRRPSPVMAEKCCWLSRKSRSLGSSTEAKQIHGSLRNYSKLWLSIFHNQSINQSITASQWNFHMDWNLTFPQSRLHSDEEDFIFAFFLLSFNCSPAFTTSPLSCLHRGQYLWKNDREQRERDRSNVHRNAGVRGNLWLSEEERVTWPPECRSKTHQSSSSGNLSRGGVRQKVWKGRLHSSHSSVRSNAFFTPHTWHPHSRQFRRGLSLQWPQSGSFSVLPENERLTSCWWRLRWWRLWSAGDKLRAKMCAT